MAGQSVSFPVQLSNQEIKCWSDCTMSDLCAWEFQTIRSMSYSYVDMLHKASSKEIQMPYGKTVDNLDRQKVSKDIKNYFAALKAKK